MADYASSMISLEDDEAMVAANKQNQQMRKDPYNMENDEAMRAANAYNAGYQALRKSNPSAYTVDQYQKEKKSYNSGFNYRPNDRTSEISAGYDTILGAQKRAIAEGVNANKLTYQRQIQNAASQYQPLRNQAAVENEKNKRVLAETLANAGANETGGMSRTENLQLGSNYSKRINDLNLQQQGVVDDANFAMAQLEAQGRVQEAQAVADIAKEKLTALSGEASALRELAFNAEVQREQGRQFGASFGLEQDKFGYQKNIDQRNFDYTKGVDERNFTATQEQNAKDNAYRADYFAFQKDTQVKNDAFQNWATLGFVASEADAAVLGVPVGTPTSSQVFNEADLALKKQNAALAERAQIFDEKYKYDALSGYITNADGTKTPTMDREQMMLSAALRAGSGGGGGSSGGSGGRSSGGRSSGGRSSGGRSGGGGGGGTLSAAELKAAGADAVKSYLTTPTKAPEFNIWDDPSGWEPENTITPTQYNYDNPKAIDKAKNALVDVYGYTVSTANGYIDALKKFIGW